MFIISIGMGGHRVAKSKLLAQNILTTCTTPVLIKVMHKTEHENCENGQLEDQKTHKLRVYKYTIIGNRQFTLD